MKKHYISETIDGSIQNIIQLKTLDSSLEYSQMFDALCDTPDVFQNKLVQALNSLGQTMDCSPVQAFNKVLCDSDSDNDDERKKLYNWWRGFFEVLSKCKIPQDRQEEFNQQIDELIAEITKAGDTMASDTDESEPEDMGGSDEDAGDEEVVLEEGYENASMNDENDMMQNMKFAIGKIGEIANKAKNVLNFVNPYCESLDTPDENDLVDYSELDGVYDDFDASHALDDVLTVGDFVAVNDKDGIYQVIDEIFQPGKRVEDGKFIYNLVDRSGKRYDGYSYNDLEIVKKCPTRDQCGECPVCGGKVIFGKDDWAVSCGNKSCGEVLSIDEIENVRPRKRTDEGYERSLQKYIDWIRETNHMVEGLSDDDIATLATMLKEFIDDVNGMKGDNALNMLFKFLVDYCFFDTEEDAANWWATSDFNYRTINESKNRGNSKMKKLIKEANDLQKYIDFIYEYDTSEVRDWQEDDIDLMAAEVKELIDDANTKPGAKSVRKLIQYLGDNIFETKKDAAEWWKTSEFNLNRMNESKKGDSEMENDNELYEIRKNYVLGITAYGPTRNMVEQIIDDRYESRKMISDWHELQTKFDGLMIEADDGGSGDFNVSVQDIVDFMLDNELAKTEDEAREYVEKNISTPYCESKKDSKMKWKVIESGDDEWVSMDDIMNKSSDDAEYDMTGICPNCNMSIDFNSEDDSVFCQHCGEEIAIDDIIHQRMLDESKKEDEDDEKQTPVKDTDKKFKGDDGKVKTLDKGCKKQKVNEMTVSMEVTSAQRLCDMLWGQGKSNMQELLACDEISDEQIMNVIEELGMENLTDINDALAYDFEAILEPLGVNLNVYDQSGEIMIDDGSDDVEL